MGNKSIPKEVKQIADEVISREGTPLGRRTYAANQKRLKELCDNHDYDPYDLEKYMKMMRGIKRATHTGGRSIP